MKKLLLLLAASMMLFACGTNKVIGIDKANLSPKFDNATINRVAIIGFGKNVDVHYDAAIIADKFTAELVNSELFSLMDRNDIDKIMKEVGFQMKSSDSGILDDETRSRLRAIGADSILTGKLLTFKQVERGDSVLYAESHLVAKLLRIETGEVLWSAEMQQKSKMDGKKDAESAEMLLSDIITQMSVPLKTENKYKLLLKKVVK